MNYIMVDVESDGPCPGIYSMVCFGAVEVKPGLNNVFYGKTAPLPGAIYVPEALAISGFSRKEHEAFPNPVATMRAFYEWLKTVTPNLKMLRFVSDNNGYDWQFINWYFWKFLQINPFGFSSINLGSLYKGMVHDMRLNFKHLRDTRHSHNPVDDAKGNAEAMLKMFEVIRSESD